MHNNQYIYSRERRRFGRQCLFVSRHFLLVSLFPNPRQRSEFIQGNPLDRATQLSNQMALSVIVTQNVVRNDHGTAHLEGGWPREINNLDEEQTTRYRKKIEREDNWTTQVTRLVNKTVKLCLQNAAVRIYQDFFLDSFKNDADIWSPFEARKYHVFSDPILNPKRLVNNIEFNENVEDLMLVVYSPNTSEATVASKDVEEEDEKKYSIFNWEIENSLKPISSYENNTYFYKAHNCPKDENVLAGGDAAGRVSLWDNRTLGLPASTCVLEAAHREAVSALCWVHSKTNTEFISGSFDGSVKFWDGRDLSEPIIEVLLDPEPTDDQLRSRSHGVSVLEFEYTIPVRFIVASEHGHVFIGNRKGGFPTEILLSNFKLFAGPVHTVERNPFFVKNFILIGDWCAKIWSEESKNAPSSFIFRNKEEIYCGAWSTARCSLFVTGDSSCSLKFWDILLDHREPIFSIQLHDTITAIRFCPEGDLIAIGLMNGDTQLMELDKVMLSCTARERALTSALFEREQSRCKLLEGRVEELKLRANTSIWEAEQAQATKQIKTNISALNPEDPEDYMQILESDPDFKRSLVHFTEAVSRVLKKRRDRDHLMERSDFD